MSKLTLSLFLALISFFIIPIAADAQTTGATTLRVVLNPVLSIVVNDATTTITFTTAADYSGGKSVDQASHLTITNIGAQTYTLKVAAAASTMAGVTGGNLSTIPVGDVQLTVDGGAASVGTGSTANAVTLSSTAASLITSGPASLLKTLGVTYAIPPAASATLIGLTPDTYTTTVTYTISNP